MRGPELTPLQFRTCRSLDAVALRHVEGRELRMRGLDHKCAGTLRACGAAPDFADVVFKTVRQVDPGPVLLVRNRIAQRLARRPPSISARGAAPFARRRRSRFRRRRGRDRVEGRGELWKRFAPGLVSRPLIVRSTASRRSGDAFTSTIGTTSWHFPHVGSELNWQRQPKARLQLTYSRPFRAHLTAVISPSHGFRPVNAPVHS
jgi:hypothetical protein